MHQIQTDDCNSNHLIKNPWNQIFMRHDIDGQINEDYKISSSLKTIWNDVSHDKSTSSNASDHNEDFLRINSNIKQMCSQTPQSVEHVNSVIPVDRNGVQSKAAIKLGPGLDNANVNALKGRAITARNGNCVSSSGIENGNINQVSFCLLTSCSESID